MTNRALNLPNGVAVSVAQPYKEGHVLTALEATKLNQTLADSIRTSLMSKLKRLVDAAQNAGAEFDAVGVSAEFQEYADNYEFSERGTKAVVDPIEAEAHKLAKQQVFAAIRNRGGKPKDYSDGQIAEYVEKVLAHKPEIREEAARRINSTRQLAGDLLSDLGL
jgi:hypothetical protein